MRIIGGEFRSRVLAEFAGVSVRPTSDRAREALFNILSLKVRGARVLDLFSGSGALGLESLSRGAEKWFLTTIPRTAWRY
ncbi:MAG: RsmD family RNA methyltransferase [Clostridia bacterium]|nr:RsmD family RNA methyltransferase [Clostridia bacterium]